MPRLRPLLLLLLPSLAHALPALKDTTLYTTGKMISYYQHWKPDFAPGTHHHARIFR